MTRDKTYNCNKDDGHRLLGFLGLAALIMIFAKCFRLRAWHMANAPAGEQWAKHWQRFDGPKPPWIRKWEKRWAEQDQQAREQGTDAEATAATV